MHTAFYLRVKKLVPFKKNTVCNCLHRLEKTPKTIKKHNKLITHLRKQFITCFKKEIFKELCSPKGLHCLHYYIKILRF